MADLTPAPTDSQSETDLKGLDNLQMPPSLQAPLDQNVESAENERTEAAAYGDSQIEDARGDMRGALGDAQQAQNRFAAQGAGPNDHIDTLMAASPWLIALSVFGGARSKLSANNLMAAQIGMVDGINKGDQQGFETAYKKWSDEHDKLSELMSQKWSVYREMAKAYKGTIDAKQKALSVAEQAVRDSRADRNHQMTAWNQATRAAVALKESNTRFDAMMERIKHDRATEENNKTKEAGVEARAAGKGGAAAQKKAGQVQDVTSQIDAAISILQNDSGRLSPTGVGGAARRGIETVENVTGMSDDTTAHDFQSIISEIKLKAAPLLAGGSRTAKDQRELIANVVAGTGRGDTRQSTMAALQRLKAELAKDDGSAGKKIVAVTTDGKKVKYDDGSTGPNTTGAKPASVH